MLKKIIEYYELFIKLRKEKFANYCVFFYFCLNMFAQIFKYQR